MLAIIQAAIQNGDWRKAPNLIGYGRLLVSWVPGVMFLSAPDNFLVRWLAAIAFVVIVFSDMLDGWVARRWNLGTELGKNIDPLIDKVLITLTMVMLSVVLFVPWLWVITALILVREVHVTLRLRTRGRVLAAAWSGKVKMWLQSVMITGLLLPYGGWWTEVQIGLIAIAVFMTIYSWAVYYQKFVK